MTGLFEGKNAILVLLESIDTWLLTEEYMPNLYALQQSSINCTDHYSPMFISAGTFGTEFTVNTGLIPPTAGIRNEAYSTYTFPNSLAALFEEKGYTANSFHSSNPTIYDRGNIHLNWGYEAYHSYVEMGMEDATLDSQMINGYDQMVSDDPFFSFLLTYSGHGPYNEELASISQPHLEAATAAVAKAQLPEDISEDDYEEYVNAVAHAMETDALIGELVDALTADGHMEDTVLIFFTDHYCKYMTNTDLVMELKGAENSDFLTQVPFFIYSADTEPMTITKPTYSADIAPTIANLFGLDANYAYFPGNDIFGDDGGYVIFRGLNWYDGEIYYSANYDGEITDYIAQMNTKVQTSVNMAWTAMKTNYFGRLEE
jgi:phosphoglycerol transferase MdoB-like AlkP superfamily enzyme